MVVAWEVWIVRLLPLLHVDVLMSIVYANRVGTGTVAACRVVTLLCVLMLWLPFFVGRSGHSAGLHGVDVL